MFSRPTKLLIIAMDDKNEPIWGASVAPQNIALNYVERHTEIDIEGVLIDGPTPIEELLKELGGIV